MDVRPSWQNRYATLAFTPKFVFPNHSANKQFLDSFETLDLRTVRQVRTGSCSPTGCINWPSPSIVSVKFSWMINEALRFHVTSKNCDFRKLVVNVWFPSKFKQFHVLNRAQYNLFTFLFFWVLLLYKKNSINNNGEVIISGSPRKSKSRDDVEQWKRKIS